MRILFAGGGTAGHVNPALAIAKDILSNFPQSQVLFVGTPKGMEQKLIKNAGYSIESIEVSGFNRKSPLAAAKSFAKLFGALSSSRAIIKKFKPDIVIGTGGYVSGPVLFCAAQCGVKTAILEVNVIPGITSKILSRFVDRVMLSFEDSKKYFKNQSKLIVTGVPVRDELFLISKSAARQKLGLDSRPFVLMLGGSLGAQKLNSAMVDFLSLSKSQFQFMAATGERYYDGVTHQLERTGITATNSPHIKIERYIYDIATALAAADLVISRSGSTVCELTALGKAAVLIPSPNVANNHQFFNAQAMQKAGAAVILEEAALCGKSLCDCVTAIFSNRPNLLSMEKKSLAIGERNGCKNISAVITGLVAGAID